MGPIKRFIIFAQTVYLICNAGGFDGDIIFGWIRRMG